MFLYKYIFSILLGIYPGVELLGRVVTLCLTFEELPNCFPQQLPYFTFPVAMYEGSNFSTSLPIFYVSAYLSYSRLFIYLLVICISFFEKCLFKSLAHCLWQAAVTKIPKNEWLINNRNGSLTVLEAKKSKIKMLTDLVSGKSMIPGL